MAEKHIVEALQKNEIQFMRNSLLIREVARSNSLPNITQNYRELILLKLNKSDPLTSNLNENENIHNNISTDAQNGPQNSQNFTQSQSDSANSNVNRKNVISNFLAANVGLGKNGSALSTKASKSDSTLQKDSHSSLALEVCRICMGNGTESLVSPCLCKGTLGCVHVSCLERWLTIASRTSCELCGYEFNLRLTQRYSFCQALRIWFGYYRNRSTFQTDCLFFLALSIITGGLLTCCILGAKQWTESGMKLGVPEACAAALNNILMLVATSGYVATAYLLWRDHTSLWRQWRRATRDVRLVLGRESVQA